MAQHPAYEAMKTQAEEDRRDPAFRRRCDRDGQDMMRIMPGLYVCPTCSAADQRATRTADL
ncbi:hypothetical protein ABZ714_30845 [Streptomyces sp. NPDC006798]|uniref:hypothetical protein n=1 Tax=unclassified Streptomyces TaxID=2593676 RepID=UPI00332130D9